MAQKAPVLKVELRDRLGTRYARRLRKNGRLPATIYSKGTDPLSVSVDEKEVTSYLYGGNHIMELDNGDGNPATVLVKDLQFGFLGDNLSQTVGRLVVDRNSVFGYSVQSGIASLRMEQVVRKTGREKTICLLRFYLP